jgi:hypothetical protein
MYKLSLLFSMLITLTINAKTANSNELCNLNSEFIALELNQFELELNVFSDMYDITLNVEDVEVVELEEDVEINFDTTEYLPENFNVLAGKNDIDWSEVALVELEEEVELGFDATKYLPDNFSALAGKYNLNWSEVELVELEEEVELGFDTKDHLPENFNPYKGLECKQDIVVCLY